MPPTPAIPPAPAEHATPAPAPRTEEAPAQSASSEEASIKAQIENFVNQNNQTAPGAAAPAPAPSTPTPAPAKPAEETPATSTTPQANDDALMASAIKSLVSDDDKQTTAGEKTIQPPADATAPTVPETPTPGAPAPAVDSKPAESETSSEDDSSVVAHKKVIAPITDDNMPHRPDLNELLAKEGFTPEDIHNDQANPQTGLPPAPHPPGHVISPNPATGQDGVDPNSIAL